MVSVNLHVTFPWSILLLGGVLPKVKLFAERTNKTKPPTIVSHTKALQFPGKRHERFFSHHD